MFKKWVQYIAHYEVYVDGKITGRGNVSFDFTAGSNAGELHQFVVDKALAGSGSPAGGQCLVVGLFKL